MIKLNKPQFSITNGEYFPTMFIHRLTVKKEAPTFELGISVDCYINKYHTGKYAVYSKYGSKYHVFDNEQDLHDTFDEA